MARATVVIGIAGAAVVGWIVAPVVDMARRGTRDERTVRAWRREGRASGRSVGRSVGRPVTEAPIPDPRRPDEPASSTLQGRPGGP
jgi:hypothetical protein